MEIEFASDAISVEIDGHVGTLWLDSPERRNAMGAALWNDLPLAIDVLNTDPLVRVIVIAAKGKSFTVGLDLKDSFLAQGAAGSQLTDGGSIPSPSQAAQFIARRKEIKRLQDSISSVANTNKPTISYIHGHCIGGGIDLISACDIRVASPDAIFSIRETKMAIVADLGTLQRLPRIIGLGRMNELAFTGKDFDATFAKEIGLVNYIGVDYEDGLAITRQLANEIAQNSPLVVSGTKAVLRASLESTIEDGLDYVANWNAGALLSDDLMEAVSSFLEKRLPNFRGN